MAKREEICFLGMYKDLVRDPRASDSKTPFIFSSLEVKTPGSCILPFGYSKGFSMIGLDKSLWLLCFGISGLRKAERGH